MTKAEQLQALKLEKEFCISVGWTKKADNINKKMITLITEK